MSIISQRRLMDAICYAAECHRDQRRKDKVGTPYINHPLQVIRLLMAAGADSNTDVLMAAVLHDVVEDTDGTLEEIRLRFGSDVFFIVAEVTDDKSLPKVERKKQQIEHAPHLSQGARLIKLADKLSNLEDLYREVPQGWSPQVRKGYVYWALAVVDKLRGTNAVLEEWLDRVFDLLDVDARGITQKEIESQLDIYYAELNRQIK